MTHSVRATLSGSGLNMLSMLLWSQHGPQVSQQPPHLPHASPGPPSHCPGRRRGTAPPSCLGSSSQGLGWGGVRRPTQGHLRRGCRRALPVSNCLWLCEHWQIQSWRACVLCTHAQGAVAPVIRNLSSCWLISPASSLSLKARLKLNSSLSFSNSDLQQQYTRAEEQQASSCVLALVWV